MTSGQFVNVFSASSSQSGLFAALGKRDLSAVANELADVASNWVLLATCLGLDTPEVEEIRSQRLLPKEALLMVISRWLDTTDHTVTWADIVKALRQPLLKEERLAKHIEENVCTRFSEY